MRFICLQIFYIFSLLIHGMSIKIFTFDKQKTMENDVFSTVTLTNVPNKTLPEIFTICSTHRQYEFNTDNTHYIYTVYQDENHRNPWFSIGFYESRSLWALMNDTVWYEVGYLPVEMTLDWITICIEIDALNLTISSSIGGGMPSVPQRIEKIDVLPRFYLKLGLCDERLQDDFQFFGKIAKIRKKF